MRFAKNNAWHIQTDAALDDGDAIALTNYPDVPIPQSMTIRNRFFLIDLVMAHGRNEDGAPIAETCVNFVTDSLEQALRLIAADLVEKHRLWIYRFPTSDPESCFAYVPLPDLIESIYLSRWYDEDKGREYVVRTYKLCSGNTIYFSPNMPNESTKYWDRHIEEGQIENIDKHAVMIYGVNQ